MGIDILNEIILILINMLAEPAEGRESPPARLRRVGAREWHRLGWLAAAALAACAAPPEAEQGAPAAEPLLAHVRQLTFAGRRSGEGYFDATGRRLVFQSEREPGNPFYQIYLLELESGDLRRVSTGTGKTTCAWVHPGGRRVLFASTHHDPDARAKQEAELEARATGGARRYAWDFDPEYELWERDLDTGALRRLTHAPGYDAEGAWSPDGRFVVFASNRHAYAAPEALAPEERARFASDPSVALDLYRLEVATGRVERLTQSPGYDGGPFFSADGRRIVWRRFAPDGATAEIYTMPTAGGPERQLTRLGALSWAPFFHPSGDYVVFATNLHGHANFELYLVDAEGISEPVRVTDTDGFDGLPVFAPDGRRLAWTSTRGPGGASQLFLARWNDAGARRALGLPPTDRALPASAAPATPDEIDVDDLRRYVGRLTAREMEGRATGTEGERRATAYVAEVFQSLRLEPAGDDGGWFQAFEFTAGVSLAPGNRLAIEKPSGLPEVLPVDVAWRPLGFSRTGETPSSRVVFAGYGIVAPADDGVDAYDSYGELDVRDAWVLVLRYAPEQVPEAARRHWSRYASLRHKAMLARDRGALGILVAAGPGAAVREELVPLRLDGSAASSSLFALSMTNDAGAALLAPSGRSLAELETALDGGAQLEGFELPGVALAARVALLQERRGGRNVLGRLPGAGGREVGALVIGAHVDHLGRGGGGNSLARGAERERVHPGADDNASGVAALLEIAAELTAAHRRGDFVPARDVLFAAWSGEELGLLGAEHFVRGLAGGHGSDVSDAVAAYLNLDMVGRLRERLVVQGVGSSDAWPETLERVATPLELPLRPQDETYLPTDATAFYLRRVPFLSFFTGAHAEYHTPDDTAEKLDYAGLERVSGLVARLAADLARRPEAPAYVSQEPPRGAGSRAGLRASLGTIPDYVETEQPGLVLSGVVAGGPAEQAGLRAGDRVVELAGRSIESIYDYTYAIEGLAIGVEVEVVVIRAGERLPLRITPASRD